MKLAQVIEQVNEEKPNSFKPEKLTSFINEVEADVQVQLRIPEDERITYDYKEDGNRELLAKPPYDRLYKSYLKAMIDYSNEEYASYENNQAQHVADFREFTDSVVRSGRAQSIPTRFKNIW